MILERIVCGFLKFMALVFAFSAEIVDFVMFFMFFIEKTGEENKEEILESI